MKPTGWMNERSNPRYSETTVKSSGRTQIGHKVGPQAKGKTQVRGRDKVDDGHQDCKLASYRDRRAQHGR